MTTEVTEKARQSARSGWFTPPEAFAKPTRTTAVLFSALFFMFVCFLLALHGDDWQAYLQSSPLIILSVVATSLVVGRYCRTRASHPE